MKMFFIDSEIMVTYEKFIFDINCKHEEDSAYGQILNIISKLVENKKFTNLQNLKNYLILNKDLLFLELETSGTTGKPKIVKQKLSNITRYVKETSYNNVWGFAYNPIHFAGLQVLFQCLFNEDVIVLLYGKKILDASLEIKKHNVNVLTCTPTFANFILEYSFNLSSLQSISLGGERLPEPTYKKIKNTLGNIKVRNIYASTEAGSLLCSDGYGFEIPKRYLNLIKIDEDNTIIIHKSLMGDTSYQGDWYNTGDKVRFIDTKKFVFDSREKEYFNVGGNRVSPAKIEEQILMLSGVELCLVYPVKNSLMGNLVGIKVKKHKDYSETDLAKSIKFCDTLERYERPKIIDFVEDLQLTNTGKVKRI